VAERLVNLLHGKVKIEDAGFDWKVCHVGTMDRKGGREGKRGGGRG